MNVEKDPVPAGMERVTVRRRRTVQIAMVTGTELVAGELRTTYGTQVMGAGETVLVPHDEAAELHAAGFVVSPTRPELAGERPGGTGSHPTHNPAGIGAVPGMTAV